MEKDIGKIKKSDNTDIIVRIDDFGGNRGITIREFVNSEKYTGFTKSGTRIPVEQFIEFRNLINAISLNDINADVAEGIKEEEIKEVEKAEEKVKEAKIPKENKETKGQKKLKELINK